MRILNTYNQILWLNDQHSCFVFRIYWFCIWDLQDFLVVGLLLSFSTQLLGKYVKTYGHVHSLSFPVYPPFVGHCAVLCYLT